MTPQTASHQASLSFTISWSLLRFMSIESVMLSNQLILCHPLLLLPSVLPSTRVLSNESALRIKGPKYWNFSFSTSPSSEYLGSISSRIDWFGLLAVKGAFKNCLQHYSSKASIIQHSAFFMVQLSHLYMTTGKTIALTIWTFVGKMMSLLFNMLSRFVIAFLPRKKCLLIPWLLSPSTLTLQWWDLMDFLEQTVLYCSNPYSGCEVVPDTKFFIQRVLVYGQHRNYLEESVDTIYYSIPLLCKALQE